MTDVKLGQTSPIIVDSAMTLDQALAQNPEFPCPPEILEAQRLIPVRYFSFDSRLHLGQIVINEELVEEVSALFNLILKIRFPLTSVIPVVDSRFHWDDILSMEADNSSGFNYRRVVNKDRLSRHAYGYAIDIGPRQNPYYPEGMPVLPSGAVYDPLAPGTFLPRSEIVRFMKARGWNWRGESEERDYHHFDKPIK